MKGPGWEFPALFPKTLPDNDRCPLWKASIGFYEATKLF